MLYTTFQVLVDSEENEELIQRIESFTGSRLTYGMLTPIPMQGIAESVGLEVASTALSYSTENANNAGIAIAIEWLRNNDAVWNLSYPGYTYVGDLLYALEQYHIGIGTIIEPRLDYCGDPIPGSDANVFLVQINDLTSILTGIYTAIDTFDYTAPTYELYLYNSQNDPNTPAGWTRENTNYIDPVGSQITGLTGYIPGQTSQLMDDDALIGHTAWTYNPGNSRRFDRATYTMPNSEGAQDQSKLALRYTLSAVLLLKAWVVGDSSAALPRIHRFINLSYEYYRGHQRSIREPLISRLNAIAAEDIESPPLTGYAEWQPYMDQIMAEELNLRAALLRDPVFVNSYGDTNLNNILTEAERVALETEVNIRRRPVRRAKAQELVDTAVAEQAVWDSFVPQNLLPIFVNHVM